MARVTVYVPDELREEALAHAPRLNLSRIFQEGVRAQLQGGLMHEADFYELLSDIRTVLIINGQATSLTLAYHMVHAYPDTDPDKEQMLTAIADQSRLLAEALLLLARKPGGGPADGAASHE